jgi:hypothetical protein
MSRTDYRTMIDRGRKAGLGTSELYRAMATMRQGVNQAIGQSDGNGFVSVYNEQGQRVYQPVGNDRRA